MNTATKLGAFAVGLITAFGAAAGVGSAVGPTGEVAQHGSPDTADSDPGHEGGDTAHGSGADTATGKVPGGLMVSQRGYALALGQESLPAGEAVPTAFQILGPDSSPVTGYEQTHEEDLHLIAVRRDMTGFQHVHPERADDGTWTSSLDLTAGQWRVFADFAPTGHEEAMTLGADLAVAGDYDPRPLPEPAASTEVDGYTVTLDGELVPGEESELTLSVSKDGQPVTDLQPYLASYGHLVALRDGDLAYLHVHPAGAPGDRTTEPGPDVTFYATAPSAGDYRLFLDFKHDGAVRTAELTTSADGTASSAGSGTGGAPEDADEHSDTGSDDHGH